MKKIKDSEKTEKEIISKIENNQVKSAEEVYLNDLILRHKRHLDNAKQDFIRDVTYSESMEIHRFLEKRLNRSIPLNHSCAQCVLEEYKLFLRIIG